MGYENDICQLASLIADAAEDLRTAAGLAIRLTGIDAADDKGWPAMGRLVDQLDTVNAILVTLPCDEIRDAIRQAHEEIDDMSDRADGISY